MLVTDLFVPLTILVGDYLLEHLNCYWDWCCHNSMHVPLSRLFSYAFQANTGNTTHSAGCLLVVCWWWCTRLHFTRWRHRLGARWPCGASTTSCSMAARRFGAQYPWLSQCCTYPILTTVFLTC